MLWLIYSDYSNVVSFFRWMLATCINKLLELTGLGLFDGTLAGLYKIIILSYTCIIRNINFTNTQSLEYAW